jgi:beta-galactosidase
MNHKSHSDKPIKSLSNPMRKGTIFVSLIVAGVSSPAQAYDAPASQRANYNFNANWRLNVGDVADAQTASFNDAAWQNLTLPYAWNEDDAFKLGIDKLRTGIAWYRKSFKLPANSTEKKVYIEFEGIRHGGEFFLNGESIGRSENGVMAFGFDITDKVKPAPAVNVLAAKIDSAWNYKEVATGSGFQWSDRNFYANYGGINKNVKLHITDKLHQTLPLYSNLGTTGTYVYAQNYDIAGKSATVTAEAQVKNEHTQPRTFSYEVVVEDMAGKVVKTINGPQTTLSAGQTQTVKASARIEGLNFWSWGYGYLYNVYTILKVNNQPVDVVKTRTGFRKLEFGNGMVKLNDRVVHLKGYAQRTTNEWPALGINIPAWVSDLSNRLMVESNGNLVRWMHVTPSKQDVESCDRVGLMQALPAGDSERDVTGRRWELRVLLMRDATIYNRNNPSVVMYEGGNTGISEEHMQELKEIRDLYDPNGGRASGSREMLDSKIAEWGGEMLYINKSASIPFWATEYSRDEGMRKYWDDFSPPFHKNGDGPPYKNAPAPSYNHNQDSHAIENVRRWYDYWRERPGTGLRVNAGGTNIIFSDSNTHYRGESNYRTSGEVDSMRLPKDGFFAHKVMWDGWVDTEKPAAHILGHWDYTPEVKKPVYVVSSAEKVELFVNGQSKGFGEQKYRFLYTFPDVQWQSGQVRAVGYDANGKQICEDTRKTSGAPAAIRLTPRTSPNGLRADGADLALVDVEVVDAQGNRCPTALNLIDFALTGPAQWRGGIAQGPDNYILSKSLPVEGGINRVALRSQLQSGKISLTATAKGLKSASIELTSKAVSIKDGLSSFFPDAELPSYLDRGPTPRGASFQMLRQPIKIVGVKAGANLERAAQSFDDNERTSWSNDDDRAKGWIEYQLERPAKVSEITLKMGGWRNKSYPIRIKIDGTEVWSGDTPQSLGYITIPFEPTTGKTLSIELTGSTVQRDAFGAIVELENEANADTIGGGKAAKGSLNIVEVEIYEPIPGVQSPTPRITTSAPAVSAATSPASNTISTQPQPAVTKPLASTPGGAKGTTAERSVVLRTANASSRYATAVPNGGLNTRGTTITNSQIFVLVDLNGGTLTNNDEVHIKWAPPGAKPTFWQEGGSGIGRKGGNPDARCVFKVKLKEKVTANNSLKVVLQTASGKFVSVPSAGAALATVDKEDQATPFEILDNPTAIVTK